MHRRRPSGTILDMHKATVMRRMLGLAALVFGLAACKPPYVILNIIDSSDAAEGADHISLVRDNGDMVPSALATKGFPVRLVITANHGAVDIPLVVEARAASEVVLARGLALVRIPRHGSRSYSVQLGADCGRQHVRGLRCALATDRVDGGLSGVCVAYACQQRSCGNGYTDNSGEGGVAVEECDDGNANNDDDCLTSCLWATCGDGHTNRQGIGAAIEECDTARSTTTVRSAPATANETPAAMENRWRALSSAMTATSTRAMVACLAAERRPVAMGKYSKDKKFVTMDAPAPIRR